MLVSIPILLSAFTYPFWGRIVDRFGSKPALLLAGLLVINGASAWIFVTRDHWVFSYLCAMLATMAWPGMYLAGFNLLLRITATGDKNRARWGFPSELKLFSCDFSFNVKDSCSAPGSSDIAQ